MSTNESIALLLACVVLYVVACDVLRAGRARDLRERVARERNRNRFGELRTRLLKMAVENRLDPRSSLFSAFYKSLTALMRNPHEFENAAQLVLTLPVPERLGAKRPTRSEGEIARDFAHRLDLLCRDYFRFYAAGAWLIDRIDRKGHPLWVEMLAQRAGRRPAGSLIAARQRLEQTAQSAAA
jgi:hypothetical protein